MGKQSYNGLHPLRHSTSSTLRGDLHFSTILSQPEDIRQCPFTLTRIRYCYIYKKKKKIYPHFLIRRETMSTVNPMIWRALERSLSFTGCGK